MIKRTDELDAGNVVQLPGGIVRTVDEIADSGYVNYRDEPIFYVNYREGRTREWSSGNSGIARSTWEVLA